MTKYGNFSNTKRKQTKTSHNYNLLILDKNIQLTGYYLTGKKLIINEGQMK